MSVEIPCIVDPENNDDISEPFFQSTNEDEIRNDFSVYLCDESRMTGGFSERLVFPRNETQIAELTAQCYREKKWITVSGGRTGLVGGAVPLGGILLSTEKMKGIRPRPGDNDKLQLFILPGETLSSLSDYVINHCPDWFYPPDPTEKTASIGGIIATNASGSRSYKYGQTRKYVELIRIVLSDGSVAEISRGKYSLHSNETYSITGRQHYYRFQVPQIPVKTIKNTAGYYVSPEMDLIDLFIGSEGTLGIITGAEIGLCRKPETRLAAVAFFRSESEVFNFLFYLKNEINRKNEIIDPSALEYFDLNSLNLLRNRHQSEGKLSQIREIPPWAQSALFFEQECGEIRLEQTYEAYATIFQKLGYSMDDTWGALNDEELMRLNLFRHAVPETVNMVIAERQKKLPELTKISTDFVVPESNMSKMMKIYHKSLDSSGLEHVIFGHIGENHIHVNILPKNHKELLHAKKIYLSLAKSVLKLSGTISGEHGIGKLKKYLFREMYDSETIQKFYALKTAFDPECLLGRHTLFDT